MVPCQPRQLVIYSLPLAALVAFFWYKRRKNLSHSDPGGTLALKKPVDKAAEVSAPKAVTESEIGDLSGKELGEKIVDECYAKNIVGSCTSPPKIEQSIVKTIEEIASSPLTSEKIIDELKSAVHVKPSETIHTIEKGEIICNGVAVHTKDVSVVVSVVEGEVENLLASPDFKSSGVFHSTIIEDEKDLKESEQNCVVQDKAVEGILDSCKLNDLETEDNIDYNCAGKDNIHNTSATQQESEENNQNIHFEDQSTLENFRLEDKVIAEDNLQTSAFTENSSESTVLVDDIAEQSNLTVKDLSSTNSKTTEKLGDISTDTGISSQDRSASEDLSNNMAQGPKTEEKSQSNGSGLEQKLASLGLDTQPPAQRDSANHSPAEVMLNSPAISTYSDAHSEGSSDSGKGCSDVVTPPSCTPAGGSSVAGDQVPSVYEFVLPQVIVGRLIGRHGTFLHDIRAKTHTNVFIKRHPETNSLKICAIEGTQQDIDAALKMIRQKFPLRRFPELTLERVTFVKNSCLPISPENLQLHLVEGVNNDVLLSSLISAGHFFLQLPMHMSYQSLYRLACIMNSVYNTEESPPLPDPQPDVICVAPAHGGWYRAQILSVDEDAHTSNIKFLDYGGFLAVDNSTLRQIRGDFLLLPFQAVECVLANVIPAGGEEEWSEDAKQLVQLMTTQQTLQAQVYDYTDTGLPLIYLYCTQFYQSPTDPTGFETKVVLLNQELVSNGFADLIEVSQGDEQTTVTESS